MPAKFQVVAFSAVDTEATNIRGKPKLLFPDAIRAAQEMRAEGIAFRVVVYGEHSDDQIQAFRDIGAFFD